MATHHHHHHQNIDRISQLPEPILGHIVSFLPFKEAGKTCILSKKWTNIWKCTSNIELDEFMLSCQSPSSSNVTNTRTRRRVFIDFIKKWFFSSSEELLPEEINTFHLKLSHPDEFRLEVEDFIKFVISKKVKDLDLEFSDKELDNDTPDNNVSNLFDLPEYVYEHVQQFESLKISACNLKVSKLKNNLKGLKKISLGWIELSCSSLQSLISNCEVLESLSLKKCRKLDEILISMNNNSNSRLRILVIEDCDYLIQISIEIPSLRFFKYVGAMMAQFYLGNLTSIEEVEFDFGVETEYVPFGETLVRILNNLDGIKVLTLCSYVTQVVDSGEDELNLYTVDHLILKTGLLASELPGIAFLLRRIASLKTLTIQLTEPVRCLDGYEQTPGFSERRFWYRNVLYLPSLKRNQLKEVKVEGFSGKQNEIEFVEYLLDKGGSLQSVTIHCSTVVPEIYKDRVREWLKSNVRRASRKVLICVY